MRMTEPGIKIGIIGYGTACREVCTALDAGEIPGCALTSVLVRAPEKYAETPVADRVTSDLDAFLASGVQVVVEGAGHAAVKQVGPRALAAGADLVLSSVGALGDAHLYDEIMSLAATHGRRVYLPSCAIAGLDRIAAAREDGLQTVRLTTRKPVKAWRGTLAEEQVNLDTLTEPVSIFNGSARDSSRLFPESVNVSAALSLAGLGFDATEVEVIVDPTIEKNFHEVFAAGRFGEMRLQVQNTPSPNNPKTGFIVAMSLRKVLRSMVTPLQVGL